MVDLFNLTFANEKSGQNFEVSVSDLIKQPERHLKIEVEPLKSPPFRNNLRDSEWVLKNEKEAEDIYLVGDFFFDDGKIVTLSPRYYIIQPKISQIYWRTPFNYIECRITTNNKGKLRVEKVGTGEGGTGQSLNFGNDKNYWEWMTTSRIWLVKSLSNQKQTFINWKESPFDQK